MHNCGLARFEQEWDNFRQGLKHHRMSEVYRTKRVPGFIASEAIMALPGYACGRASGQWLCRAPALGLGLGLGFGQLAG